MFNIIILAFVYFMSVSLAHADDMTEKDMQCSRLQELTMLFGKRRDEGVNLSTAIEAVATSKVDLSTRAWAYEMLPVIYEAEHVTPSVMGSIVYANCMKHVRIKKNQPAKPML
jgi:hypothetical protein